MIYLYFTLHFISQLPICCGRNGFVINIKNQEEKEKGQCLFRYSIDLLVITWTRTPDSEELSHSLFTLHILTYYPYYQNKKPSHACVQNRLSVFGSGIHSAVQMSVKSEIIHKGAVNSPQEE